MLSAPSPSVSSKRLLLDLNGAIVEATAEALAALCRERNDVVGRPLPDFVETPDPEALKGLLKQAANGTPVRSTFRLAAGNGLQSSGELYLVSAGDAIEAIWGEGPEEDAGNTDDFLVTRTPVFERLFQAYLQLQEANKRKTAMMAAATHEVKTPLAIMSGACDLLLTGKLGTLNESQLEMVSLFHQNCQRLLNVMQTILSYSASEHGKLLLRMEKEDVDALLLETAEQWRPVAKSRGIRFAQRIAPNLPPVVCDRSKLQTVVNGLCDNAVKFTPTGGRITVSAEPHFWDRRFALASITEERRKRSELRVNSIRVSVADTGVGIPGEFHQEIFDEYFQAPGARSGGMGLGLAISREIIAGHKGKIWVESEAGRGSTFHFVLPL
jgi:signal transduction histidine kinase